MTPDPQTVVSLIRSQIEFSKLVGVSPNMKPRYRWMGSYWSLRMWSPGWEGPQYIYNGLSINPFWGSP